jgi:SAM-dependent methyltransferase
VGRYDIRRRTVLEIGCGKGDFLTRLCEVGDNRGIGIDPGYVFGRGKEDPRVEFIKDFYDHRYAHLQADVIACRHTLEHIPAVGPFVRDLRKTLGDRTDTLVFFEVPDVGRVLREGAFWDIYYEHCSYFTPGSLARLFRASSFEVLDLWLDYDQQYIMLMARPTADPTQPRLPLEDDAADTAAAVGVFQQRCREQVLQWQDHASRNAGSIAVWGSGSKGVAFLTTLKLVEQAPWVVDINPYRQGKFMPGTGQKILAPWQLIDLRPQEVVIMNPVYREEIRRDLERMGLCPTLKCL